LPGALLHCCPSPRSIGSFTVWPSARRKVSYRWSNACTQYSPAGTCARLRSGSPKADPSIVACWPAFNPSPSMPNTCCVLRSSLICSRGSFALSVESNSSILPSKGSLLMLDGNERTKRRPFAGLLFLWADACRHKPATDRLKSQRQFTRESFIDLFLKTPLYIHYPRKYTAVLRHSPRHYRRRETSITKDEESYARICHS